MSNVFLNFFVIVLLKFFFGAYVNYHSFIAKVITIRKMLMQTNQSTRICVILVLIVHSHSFIADIYTDETS